MSRLTKAERETVIVFNDAEAGATFYTASKTVIARMDKLMQKDPTIKVTKRDSETATYTMPKSFIKFRLPRQLSDEQRQNMADRLKEINKAGR